MDNKRKLVVLILLIIILALIGFLLLRRKGGTEIAAGSSFSFLTSIYGFTTPLGVGTDTEDNLWISNTSKGEVLRYDSNVVEQGRIDTLNEKGEPVEFVSPDGIAVDDQNGRIYVADFNWLGVHVFDKSGNFVYNLPRDPNALSSLKVKFAPYGVAAYGDRVYTTSQDGIYVFDGEGNFVSRWGSQGKGNNQFDFPNGIAVDHNNGNVYVADSNNSRLVAYAPDGKVRWLLGENKVQGGEVMQLPRGVSVAPNGNIFVTDAFQHAIYIISPEGKLLSKFGERGTADGQFSFPEGISISPSNKMYLADRQNNRVQIWQLSDDLPKTDPSLIRKWEDALTVEKS